MQRIRTDCSAKNKQTGNAQPLLGHPYRPPLPGLGNVREEETGEVHELEAAED